jgi:mannose-6-phosphate isomerase-like protein (cupin superfamily)
LIFGHRRRGGPVNLVSLGVTIRTILTTQPTPHHERNRNQRWSTWHPLSHRWFAECEHGNVRTHDTAGLKCPTPHSHSNNEELVYVLEGTLRYTVGSDTRDLARGQSMHTPRGTVHAFSNPFDSVARALIVLSPDIGAQYFKDVAAVVNAGGPPDKAALVAVMSRYGLVPSAPK